MAKRNRYTRRFNDWWEKTKQSTDTKTELYNFLNYAGKTVAIRGDIDQQKLVYTIRNRFNNSQYKTLSKANAFRVYSIVDQQQQNFRKEKAKIYRLLNQLEHQADRPNVVVKRTVRRRLINGTN